MKKYIIFSFILIALLGYNLLFWHNIVLGLFLLVIYLYYYGRRLGIIALPNFNNFWHCLLGPLLLLAGLSISGSIIYYAYALTDNIIIAILCLFPLAIIPYCQIKKRDIETWESGELEPVPLVEPKVDPVNFWSWIIIAGDLLLFSYLFTHSITDAVRSPWIFISYKFFTTFFVLNAILIIYLKKTKSSLHSLLTIFIHVSLMLSIALIIYVPGFGFDPVLHRAAEEYIYKFGAIIPKTPYYIGQYILVVMLSKITGISLFFIDKILLILLEAIYIPILIFIALRHGLDWQRDQARLGSIIFFALPFSQMIATTPQALANFFSLATILFGLTYLNTALIKWWVLVVLTATTLFIHPLAGLPIAFYCLILFVLKWRTKQNTKIFMQILSEIFIFILFAFSIFIVPFIFVNFLNANFHWPTLVQIQASLPPLPTPRLGQPLSIIFTPLYYFNYFLLLLVLFIGVVGFIKLFKDKINKNIALLLLLGFIIFYINSLTLKYTLDFANIGQAEQGQYAERLYYFSFYLLFPLVIVGVFSILKTLKLYGENTRRFSTLFIALGGALLLTASLYISYPAVDNYAYSHYINTSTTDIQAVHQIDENANGEPYIVLSNISFSAASIQEFGFKKYFTTTQGEIFYYALPTGSPMYHYFEKMSYMEANKQTMQEAMDLAGVKIGYFVLNDYWDSFKKAKPEAEASSDEHWVINNKIWVFKYKR